MILLDETPLKTLVGDFTFAFVFVQCEWALIDAQCTISGMYCDAQYTVPEISAWSACVLVSPHDLTDFNGISLLRENIWNISEKSPDMSGVRAETL